MLRIPLKPIQANVLQDSELAKHLLCDDPCMTQVGTGRRLYERRVMLDYVFWQIKERAFIDPILYFVPVEQKPAASPAITAEDVDAWEYAV